MTRLPLLAVWALWFQRSSGWAAAAAAMIILTDLLDGAVARRLGTASRRGAVIDAACDSIVAVVGCVAIAQHDPRYYALLGSIGASLSSWTGHSILCGRLVYSPIGKCNGGACFAAILCASTAPILVVRAPGLGAAVETTILAAAIALLLASTYVNVAGIVRQSRCRSRSAASCREEVRVSTWAVRE